MLNLHAFLHACLPSHGVRGCLAILLLLFFSECGGLVSATCCRKRLQAAPVTLPTGTRSGVAKKASGFARVAPSPVPAGATIVASIGGNPVSSSTATLPGTSTISSSETPRSTDSSKDRTEAEQDLDRNVFVADDRRVNERGPRRKRFDQVPERRSSLAKKTPVSSRVASAPVSTGTTTSATLVVSASAPLGPTGATAAGGDSVLSLATTRLGTSTISSSETPHPTEAESRTEVEQGHDWDVLLSDHGHGTEGEQRQKRREQRLKGRKKDDVDGNDDDDEIKPDRGVHETRGKPSQTEHKKNTEGTDRYFEQVNTEISADKTKRATTNETGNDLDYRWSAWSVFTACSRSCGIGVKSRHRTCYKFGSVSVQVSGQRCRGNTEHYVTCNTQPCPPGSRDFRQLQCAFFNGQTYAGHKRKWRPARTAPSTLLWNTTSLNPCALVCAPEKMNWLVVKFSRVVVDGTSCGLGSICTAGKCIPVGCDNKLYSHSTQDWCGVCGGDNSTCYLEKGIIRRNISAGYEELLHLPKFARHIKIVERGQNNVVLALRNEQGQYVLNGAINTKYPSVTKLVSGTIFYYHHAVYNVKGLETLHAEGPINSSLTVVSFTPEKSTVIRLKFEYVLPVKNSTFLKQQQEEDFEVLNSPDNSEPTYAWQTLLYSQVLFGHIPSSLRNQLLLSTEQSPTTPHLSMPMRQYSRSRFPLSSLSRKSDEKTLQIDYQNPDPNSNPDSKRVTDSSKKHSVPSALPMPERKMESQAVDGNYRGGYENRGLQQGETLWRQGPADYYRRLYESHEGLVTPSPHLLRSLWYSPPVTPALISASKQTEKRKHIFVRIVAPSVSSITDRSTSEGDTGHDDENRPRENGSPNKQPNLSVDYSKGDAARNSHNKSARKFQIQKKGFPIFLSAVIRPHDEVDEYQTLDSRHANRINTTSPDSNGVLPVGKSLLYSWRANVISPCSLTCDAGIQFTYFSCYNILAEKVDDEFCTGQPQPDASYHECTRNQCQARWVAGLWSVCSRSCDLGEQFRSVRCWRMLAPGFDSSVHDYLCPAEETPISTRKCNEVPCGPQWEMSPWSECSSLCGFGIQRRHVQCNAGEERLCARSSRPSNQKSCFHPPCVNTWHVSEWSKCNGPCGRGTQRRDVMCISREGKRTDVRYCDKNTRPLTVQGCGSAPYCASMWVPQAYDVCSASCGVGLVTRKVVCGKVVNFAFQLQSDAHCRHKPRPKSSTPCRSKNCGPQWYVTEWSKCSKTCGHNAVRVRETTCYYQGFRSHKCKASQKPATVDRCAETKCPQNDDECKDEDAVNCELVQKINHCQNSYYKKACCKTCLGKDDVKREDEDDEEVFAE